MEKKRSKSDSYILETGEYYEKGEYAYDRIGPETMEPIISQCIYISSFTLNSICQYCHQNIDKHVINKNKSIRQSPILIETEPRYNDQSIRESPTLVDYTGDYSFGT